MKTSAILTKEHRLCLRCGKLCRPAKSENPDARPFRKALRGLCPDCVTTNFLLSVEPIKDAIVKNGLGILQNPIMQKQFALVLEAGGSELQIEEINWNRVIENWEMSWPKGFKPK